MTDGPYDIGPAEVLQRTYGWYAENWNPPPIEPQSVPPDLRDLIPLALRFGVRCDVTRHDVAEKTSPDELTSLSRALSGRHEAIWDFVYSLPVDSPSTPAMRAFSLLLLFEAEECGGPGVPGLLQHALMLWRRVPTADSRERLEAACRATKAMFGDDVPKSIREDLRAAEAVLGESADSGRDPAGDDASR